MCCTLATPSIALRRPENVTPEFLESAWTDRSTKTASTSSSSTIELAYNERCEIQNEMQGRTKMGERKNAQGRACKRARKRCKRGTGKSDERWQAAAARRQAGVTRHRDSDQHCRGRVTRHRAVANTAPRRQIERRKKQTYHNFYNYHK